MSSVWDVRPNVMDVKSNPNGTVKKREYEVGGDSGHVNSDALLTRLDNLEKEVSSLKKENKEIKEKMNGLILYLKSAYVLVNNSTAYLSSLDLSRVTPTSYNMSMVNELPMVFKRFLTKEQLAYIYTASMSGVVNGEFFRDIYPDLDIASLSKKFK